MSAESHGSARFGSARQIKDTLRSEGEERHFIALFGNILVEQEPRRLLGQVVLISTAEPNWVFTN